MSTLNTYISEFNAISGYNNVINELNAKVVSEFIKYESVSKLLAPISKLNQEAIEVEKIYPICQYCKARALRCLLFGKRLEDNTCKVYRT